MNKAIAAALMSALLLPGAGHLYLKHYKRGWLLIVICFAAMGIIVAEALNQATAILQKLEQEGGAIDTTRIVELATQSTQNTDGTIISMAIFALFISWVIGWIDAYRLGK